MLQLLCARSTFATFRARGLGGGGLQRTWPKGPYSSALISGMYPKIQVPSLEEGPGLKEEGRRAVDRSVVSAKHLHGASTTININFY